MAEEHRSKASKQQKREYSKEYRSRPENKERARITSKTWGEQNKERRLENNRRSAAKPENKERKRLKSKQNRIRSPFKHMLATAKCRAKRKGIEFSLIERDLVKNDTCPVLGISIIYGDNRVTHNSPSIDRIDNSMGYIPGNVNIISWRANSLKKDGTLQEFEKIVSYMSKAK